MADQWAKDWQPVEALKIMENALTRNNNKVDAVVASNDGTAGGAIQALGEQKLTGKVLVTGQDADLAACQRIVAGTQTMTVYKPIKTLARKAAEVAILLARKQPLAGATRPAEQRQEGRAQHPARPDRGGQGQPHADRDHGRLPQARGRLPGRAQGAVRPKP